jgi:hypothetical protein
MEAIIAIVLAAGALLGLVLHALGKKHPSLEAAAEVVDKVEGEIKTVSGK